MHTHAHAQCSPISVGLTQACNITLQSSLIASNPKAEMFPITAILVICVEDICNSLLLLNMAGVDAEYVSGVSSIDPIV